VHRSLVRIGRDVLSSVERPSPVFEISGPVTRSPVFILTRSHPRSLLSIARSNRARLEPALTDPGRSVPRSASASERTWFQPSFQHSMQPGLGLQHLIESNPCPFLLGLIDLTRNNRGATEVGAPVADGPVLANTQPASSLSGFASQATFAFSASDLTSATPSTRTFAKYRRFYYAKSSRCASAPTRAARNARVHQINS